MAEGNNILNRPFGLNVSIPSRTLQQAQETAAKNLNLFNPVMDYLDQNENVFNGDVAREIDKYNRMAYALGAVMRDGKREITFDTRG